MQLLPVFKRDPRGGIVVPGGSLLALVTFFVLACYLLFYVCQYGVNYPLLDDWDSVDLVGKLHHGTLRIHDLFALHNEHRIFFPKLVMLLNGAFFSFNLKLQMYLSAALWIIVCWLLVSSFLDVVSDRSAYLAMIVPLILLNIKQSQNFLWGFQITFISAIVLPIVCFYLLQGDASRGIGAKRFSLALFLGGVASFSSLHGLFVWPAALCLLSKERKFQLCWAVTGAVTWSGYFYGYQSLLNHPSMGLALARPLASLRFLASLAGNLVTGSESCAVILGALFLGLFAVLSIKGSRERKSDGIDFWHATARFSFLSLAAITVGRTCLGATAAFASRYVTFSAIFLVAVLALGVTVISSWKWLRSVLTAMVTAVIMLLPMSYEDGIIMGQNRYAALRERYLMLPHYRAAGSGTFSPDSRIDRERVSILEAIGHGAFN